MKISVRLWELMENLRLNRWKLQFRISKLVYRTVNSFFGVAALFIAFWTIAFKPFHNLG